MLYDMAEVIKHYVDLNRSHWDKERSDKKRGIYYFDHSPDAKVYIRQADYKDSNTRPGHILKFISLDNVAYYRAKFGAEIVTTDDPYWPEPMVPDAEGKYVITDAVLIKIADMEGYLNFREKERARGNVGHESIDGKFNSDAQSAGVHLDTGKLNKKE